MNERINNIQNLLRESAESATNETKSSAGDKHETGRAMMQLEQENLNRQLAEALALKKEMDKIKPDISMSFAGLGSLVITDKGNYYISIGGGKIEIEKQVFYAVSPVSPIGRTILNKKPAEKVYFNNQALTIVEVY